MRRIGKWSPKDTAYTVWFIVVVCMLVLSAVWAYREYMATPPYVDPIKYPVRGIDISHHNGEIDFGKVASSGMEFVFVKASEGVNHRDTLFKANMTGARKAGLKVGAYHFFRFEEEGVDQAVNFLQAVGYQHLDLGFVIDVEKTGNSDTIPSEMVKARLGRMVDYMNLLGHRVMIYTNLDGYCEYIEDTLPGYPLWICRFQENPINTEWTFWQYDHHGKVEGIEKEVDLNAFCGTREEWERYLDGKVWPYTET